MMKGGMLRNIGTPYYAWRELSNEIIDPFNSKEQEEKEILDTDYINNKTTTTKPTNTYECVGDDCAFKVRAKTETEAVKKAATKIEKKQPKTTTIQQQHIQITKKTPKNKASSSTSTTSIYKIDKNKHGAIKTKKIAKLTKPPIHSIIKKQKTMNQHEEEDENEDDIQDEKEDDIEDVGDKETVETNKFAQKLSETPKELIPLEKMCDWFNNNAKRSKKCPYPCTRGTNRGADCYLYENEEIEKLTEQEIQDILKKNKLDEELEADIKYELEQTNE